MEGYIKLHRQILDSRVWANDGLLKVWLWCLLKANYKDNWVTVKTGSGETEVKVKKGQFIFGRKSAGKDLKMPPSTVWKRILKLENMQNLNTQRDTHYTIISIINWDTYQDEDKKGDTQGDRQVTGREQAGNTDKKDKKDKKKYLEFVYLTDDEFEKLEKKFSQQGAMKNIEKLNNYIGSKGKKYKSHYHTILTWHNKEQNKEQPQQPIKPKQLKVVYRENNGK